MAFDPSSYVPSLCRSVCLPICLSVYPSVSFHLFSLCYSYWSREPWYWNLAGWESSKGQQQQQQEKSSFVLPDSCSKLHTFSTCPSKSLLFPRLFLSLTCLASQQFFLNKNFLDIKQWELPEFRPAFFITTLKKYIITQCVSKVTFYIFNHWDLPVVLSPFC